MRYQDPVLFLCDKVFHDIAYKAKDRGDLLAGIDEFLDEVIVLPPGEWDPAIRIEPPKSIPSSGKRSPATLHTIPRSEWDVRCSGCARTTLWAQHTIGAAPVLATPINGHFYALVLLLQVKPM